MFHHVMPSFDTYDKCSVPQICRFHFINDFSCLIVCYLSDVEIIIVKIFLNLKTYLIEKDSHLVNDCKLYSSIHNIVTVFLLSGCCCWLWFLFYHH